MFGCESTPPKPPNIVFFLSDDQRNDSLGCARYFEHGYEFLHDLREDPDELTNYAQDADHAEVLATMRARCDELRDAYGGPYVSPVAV